MSAPEPCPYGRASWSEAARFISEATGKPVSRQYLYSAWTRRDRNDFPEISCGLDLTGLLLWFRDRRPYQRGGRDG